MRDMGEWIMRRSNCVVMGLTDNGLTRERERKDGQSFPWNYPIGRVIMDDNGRMSNCALCALSNQGETNNPSPFFKGSQ